MTEEGGNRVAGQEQDAKEAPQVYIVQKDLAGWQFSRRDFLAATAAAAAAATTAGCGRTTPTPAMPTATKVAIVTKIPTDTPAPAATSTPTAKPIATPTATPTLMTTPTPGSAMCFMSDITMPENSLAEPGQLFTKTWRVRNCGTTAWGTDVTLRFVEGDQMGAPDSVPVADVAPGQSIDISVKMVAPTKPGTYRADWRLQLADGSWLGDPVWVVVLVASPDPIPAGQEGSSIRVEDKTWTLPCGSPIPPNAVCICNCVSVPAPAPSHCTCDGACTCDAAHYWYPC